MTQAVTRYHALYESIRSRRRRPETFKGADALVAWTQLKLRTRGTGLRSLQAEAKLVDRLAPQIRELGERALDEEIARVRETFLRRRIERPDIRRALALTREVARRATGEEAYLVQLTGALGLYHGRVVEMLTGEGKTLTGSIAAPLIAWERRSLHVFTVNDYLAARDAESRRPIYARCGCSVGSIQGEQSPAERAPIYANSIVYGTPKQITADYLRDQIRVASIPSPWSGRQMLGMAGPLVPGLRAALVDEADAVLIDEGVVPLIIARARHEDAMGRVYRQAAQLAASLDEGPDYSVDGLRRKAELKRRGRHRARTSWQQFGDPIWKAERRAEELVKQAIVAMHCYKRGQQYEIVDGQVVIVDEYTGRFLKDRSWEHGLHQAVEAKEDLEVTADRETLARLSFQRFFRMYPFLAGMTGTAADATREIERVYDRPVVRIPTNRPIARQDLPMRVFGTNAARWDAVVDEVERLHMNRRPVLVGTRSIEASEALSRRLESRDLNHRVLNAMNHAEEGGLIAQAGKAGAITVATNMAGRGTDIILDDESRQAGGLAVLLTEMHTAQRIDRQFIGRSGRQGDPGSAQIFACLDDELIDQHLPQARKLLGDGRGELRSSTLARRLFRFAQSKAEARSRRSRSSVLRQDDWIDKHLPGW